MPERKDWKTLELTAMFEDHHKLSKNMNPYLEIVGKVKGAIDAITVVVFGDLADKFKERVKPGDVLDCNGYYDEKNSMRFVANRMAKRGDAPVETKAQKDARYYGSEAAAKEARLDQIKYYRSIGLFPAWTMNGERDGWARRQDCVRVDKTLVRKREFLAAKLGPDVLAKGLRQLVGQFTTARLAPVSAGFYRMEKPGWVKAYHQFMDLRCAAILKHEFTKEYWYGD